MRIYNYLFYKSYLLAKRSKNFDDIPALGGLIFVAACLMFNIFTIEILFQATGIIDEYPFKPEYKYVFSIALVTLVLLYYLLKGRYKRIIDDYEQKKSGNVQLHPIFVIIIYYVVSFGLLLLAGMYKNHDWIFAQ